MNYGFFRVAAASPSIKVADTDHNADAITKLVQKAYDDGVKLIVFPELCITGWIPKSSPPSLPTAPVI